jgi:hypothetical protein
MSQQPLVMEMNFVAATLIEIHRLRSIKTILQLVSLTFNKSQGQIL